MKQTKVMNIAFGTTNPNDPNKKFWQNVGVFFITTIDGESPRFSIKLNSLPLSSEFDGYLSIFERDNEKHTPSLNTDPDF